MHRTLDQVTDACLASLTARPDRHLEIGYRLWLYNYLGGNEDADTPMEWRIRSVAGLERRCNLRYRTFQGLLPLWDAVAPNDDMPHRAVDAVLALVRELKRTNFPIDRLRTDGVLRKYDDLLNLFYAAERHFDRYDLGDDRFCIGYAVADMFSQDTLYDFDNLTDPNYADEMAEWGDIDFTTPEREFGAELSRLESYCCEVYGNYSGYLRGESPHTVKNENPSEIARERELFWTSWLKEMAPATYRDPLV